MSLNHTMEAHHAKEVRSTVAAGPSGSSQDVFYSFNQPQQSQGAHAMVARNISYQMKRKMAQTPPTDSSQSLFCPDQSGLRGSTPGSANGLPVLSFDVLQTETHGPTPAKMSRADHEFLEVSRQYSRYTLFRNLQTPIFRRPKSLVPHPLSAANRASIVHNGVAPQVQQVGSSRFAGQPLTPSTPYSVDARRYQHPARAPTILKRPPPSGIQTRILGPSTQAHPAVVLDHSRHVRMSVASPGAPLSFAGSVSAPYCPVMMHTASVRTSAQMSPLYCSPSTSDAAVNNFAPSGEPLSAHIPSQSAALGPSFVPQRSAATPNPLSFAGQISAIQRR